MKYLSILPNGAFQKYTSPLPDIKILSLNSVGVFNCLHFPIDDGSVRVEVDSIYQVLVLLVYWVLLKSDVGMWLISPLCQVVFTT